MVTKEWGLEGKKKMSCWKSAPLRKKDSKKNMKKRRALDLNLLSMAAKGRRITLQEDMRIGAPPSGSREYKTQKKRRKERGGDVPVGSRLLVRRRMGGVA